MDIVNDRKSTRNNLFKVVTIILVLIIIYSSTIGMLLSTQKQFVDNGVFQLDDNKFDDNIVYPLKGNWEFYWDQLIEPQDFQESDQVHFSGFIKVPASWTYFHYPDHGMATYRIMLTLPRELNDPAIKIKRVTRAMKVFANGKYLIEVGRVSKDPEVFQAGYDVEILDLPTGTNKVELVVQVANWDYTRGGIQESFLFGSRQTLEKEEMFFLAVQLLFVGGILGYAIYYMAIFLIQRNNKTALMFSMLCMDSVLRALIWGEAPIGVLFPKVTLSEGIIINYATGYVLIPLIALFVEQLFRHLNHRKCLRLIAFPSFLFIPLLFLPEGFRATTTGAFYVLLVLQIAGLLTYLIKIVYTGEKYGILMFFSLGIMFLGIIVDMIYLMGLSNFNITYATSLSNFVVIIAMASIQSRQQSEMQNSLLLLNQHLMETDLLREKIMTTENAFLQAQIKPHFLFNTLNSIASLAYTDGEKAAELIGYLSTYLRNSIDNENLNRTVNIKKELGLVRAYVYIELARFADRVHFVECIDPNVDFDLPPLVIQPLVENAIKHGLCANNPTIHIRLIIEKTEHEHTIIVQDNGVGIPPDKIENLLGGQNKQHIGLYNIHIRLLKRYGKGLEIMCSQGKLTTVIIRIPIEISDMTT